MVSSRTRSAEAPNAPPECPGRARLRRRCPEPSPAAPGNLRRGRFCIESNARLGLANRPRQAHTQQVRSRRFPRVLRLDPWWWARLRSPPLAADGPPLKVDRVAAALPADFGHIRVSGTPKGGRAIRRAHGGQGTPGRSTGCLTGGISSAPTFGGGTRTTRHRPRMAGTSIAYSRAGAVARCLSRDTDCQALGCQAVARPPSCSGDGRPTAPKLPPVALLLRR